jgi:hypothetical protein
LSFRKRAMALSMSIRNLCGLHRNLRSHDELTKARWLRDFYGEFG